MIITVTLNPAVDRVLEVDGFQVGQHARARLKALLPAGKGINVARGVAKLGAAAGACALVGRGEVQAYAESLRADGIECALCPISGVTRTNTTILDPVGHTTTHLREEGFTVAGEDVAAVRNAVVNWLERMREVGEHATVVFSGSLPPGMGPDAFAALLADCRAGGARLVVDTSGEALRAAVESGCVDAVKPNLLELGQCLGREVGLEGAPEAAVELLGRVRTVLLTLGERGAWLVQDAARAGMRCTVPREEVRNTVGCGDAFLAGWLYAGTRGAAHEEALEWAVAAGAACARSETATDYTRAQVLAMRTRVERI